MFCVNCSLFFVSHIKMYQLNIFDAIVQDFDLNKSVAEFLNIEDTILVNAISRSLINFQNLPKNQPYILGFSGGKDSHVLLAIYHLYLILGNEPLNLIVRFADTELEHKSLYRTIGLTKEYCDRLKIPFEIVKGKQSYWYVQFALGYPVPDFRIRWCTGKLKVKPMNPSKKVKAITGRHLGESKVRDKRLRQDNLNSCGSDTCGTDLIKNKYDPLLHWHNCQIWDALFYFDGVLLYQDCFNILKQQYEQAENKKTGSLRLGCFMCPVIGLNTLKNNLDTGLIEQEAIDIRLLLEELRTARRIKNPRTQKNGSIYVGDRRKIWNKLDKNYLLQNDFIKEADIKKIDESLKSEYSYPPTYTKDWIDCQHQLLGVSTAKSVVGTSGSPTKF